MITREQYMQRKLEIEELMKQSRRDQHNELAACNEEFELRIRENNDEYRHKRQQIFDERDKARLEIESKYKDIRRNLWIEDTQLVSEWRAGMSKEGGAL